MPTHTMKLAKTNTDEILSLLRVLQELAMLHKELKRYDFWSVEWEEFEILSKFDRDTAESFIEDLARHLDEIHFERILFNCETMLNHCADPNQDTLEFNPDITKGLQLLREWTDAEPGRRIEFPVEKMAHADLDRIGDSAHTSQCPSCTPGTLVMRRNAEGQLEREDACLHCGQRVVYTDVVDGVLTQADN